MKPSIALAFSAIVILGACSEQKTTTVAASPPVLHRAFERGFRVDHLGNLMVAGSYRLPPAQLYALFPESL